MQSVQTQLVDVIDVVQSWGIRYDGGKDPLFFIERVEELSAMYRINIDLLPSALPIFFQDRALLWFRNNKRHWDSWNVFKSDFLKFFLPARYFERLDDDVRSRFQRPMEKFKDYVLSIQSLMRHTKLTETEKLERIYNNSHPNYLCYIHRRDFNNLSELIALADDFESLPFMDNTQNNRDEANLMIAKQIPDVWDTYRINSDQRISEILTTTKKSTSSLVVIFNLQCDNSQTSAERKVGDTLMKVAGATNNTISESLTQTKCVGCPTIRKQLDATLGDGSTTKAHVEISSSGESAGNIKTFPELSKPLPMSKLKSPFVRVPIYGSFMQSHNDISDVSENAPKQIIYSGTSRRSKPVKPKYISSRLLDKFFDYKKRKRIALIYEPLECSWLKKRFKVRKKRHKIIPALVQL